MKTIFSSNSDVAHNFATHDQYYGSSSNRNLYFEHNKIYSYGSHYLLGVKFLIGETKHIIIDDRGYSNSTSRHISILRSATRHFKQFSTQSIDLDVVHGKIKDYSLKIPRARQSKGFYINQIQRMYNDFVNFQNYAKKHKNKKTILNLYIIDQRDKKFKEIKYIYNGIKENLLDFQQEIIEINKKIALQKKKKNQKAIKNFRDRKTDHCRANFDVLRLDHIETGENLTDYFVRSGQGIKMNVIDSLNGIEMIKKYVSYTKNTKENDQNFIRGQKIGNYTIISFLNNILNIGCHKIKLAEILEIEKQIKKIKKITK
jgi:hypothetical protein